MWNLIQFLKFKYLKGPGVHTTVLLSLQWGKEVNVGSVPQWRKKLQVFHAKLTIVTYADPRANPSTGRAVKNVRAVKLYNATSSLLHFEHENILFYFEKTL
jgi:hypothetical protein